MSLIALMPSGKRKQIVAIGSYAEASKDAAEVAFLVREDLHGLGIGSFLLDALEEIARENHYTRFLATVLAENEKMLLRVQEKISRRQIHPERDRGSRSRDAFLPLITGHNTISFWNLIPGNPSRNTP